MNAIVNFFQIFVLAAQVLFDAFGPLVVLLATAVALAMGLKNPLRDAQARRKLWLLAVLPGISAITLIGGLIIHPNAIGVPSTGSFLAISIVSAVDFALLAFCFQALLGVAIVYGMKGCRWFALWSVLLELVLALSCTMVAGSVLRGGFVPGRVLVAAESPLSKSGPFLLPEPPIDGQREQPGAGPEDLLTTTLPFPGRS
jgi:hypothetical protein